MEKFFVFELSLNVSSCWISHTEKLVVSDWNALHIWPFVKETARHFTAKNPEKNSSTDLNMKPYAAEHQISHTLRVCWANPVYLSFSVGSLHSVSFKSETRNIRSVLLNTFGRSGRVDPSAGGWMKPTFSIRSPQWLWWALLYTSSGSPLGSNLTEDYVVTANDTHYHSHVTAL